MQELAWHFVQCQIPDDWECTHFNTEAMRGRLQFNTRNGIQATLHWRIFKHNIDEVRMINEVHKRHLEKNEPEHFMRFMELQQYNRGGFIFAHDIPGQLAHATHFDQENKIHLHWVFPNYTEERARDIFNPILESYRENVGDTRRWSLYGIKGTLPNTYGPIEIEPIPANVNIIFEVPKHHHVHLRRLGLPDIIMNGNSLFGFYGNFQKKLRRRVTAKKEFTFHGMEAVELEIEQRGEFAMDKLAGRWWRGNATIWHNKEEQRLYTFEQIGGKKTKRLELNDVFPV